MNNSKTLFLLSLTLVTAGCHFYTALPPTTRHYYLNPDKDLSAIGRVAIVQFDNYSSYPQISPDTTDALFQALQKKQLFGLTVVHQTDPAWRSLQLSPQTSAQNQNGTAAVPPTYTLEQLLEIRKALKCDAVLTGAVTEYQPYPHMTIGLLLKLVDLKDGQLLWAIEQIWDSADKTTQYRIKHYFQHQMRSGHAPLGEELVTVSSIKFIKFVAYEVAETMKQGR